MEKIKEIIKKVCTREIIFYAIFGVLTTAVNNFKMEWKHIKYNSNYNSSIICIYNKQRLSISFKSQKYKRKNKGIYKVYSWKSIHNGSRICRLLFNV